MKPVNFLCLCGAVATLLAAAGTRVSAADNARSYGPNPNIPEPQESLLPTFKWSVDGHWPDGATPSAGQGLAVAPYAQDLKHPRWLYVLPNGDVLVAEAATVPSAPKSITGLVQGWLQRRTGSITENANRITLLRDADGDGQVETRTNFLEGLNQPFGMALINDQLYVANTDSVVRFPYHAGDTRIASEGVKVIDLPVGHHWTRNLLASQDGTALYVTVGSGSNVAENGVDKEERRAAILKLDIATGKETLFASGLRNPNGMVFEPTTGALWTVVNERDMLGDDTPPDYLTSVKEGGFYGWPYSYWGQHVDTRVKPPRPDLVERAIVPDYALGAHTASLGLVYNENALSPQYRGGMFISQHGSWNRSSYSGYKVIFVPFKDGSPQGQPIDVLTGFLKPDGSGTTYGRPVGLAFDRTGALLVADDTGSTIWRVTATSEQSGLSTHNPEPR
jgi:glucose/arabinose dehydrogenase